jgi:DNA-binding NarL/FixJ family response regulator
MKKIHILIAEDQTLMRQGLRTLLESEPDFEVAGDVVDGQAAVEQALKTRPDIILMDIQMPRLNGVEATKAICARWPQARIVILTTFDRDDYVFDAVRAGAAGFLMKDVPADDLFDTVRRVHAGEVFIQPRIASRVLRAALHPGEILEPLSDRERDVLVMIAQGIPNKEISTRLSIAEGTVKNHVSNILSKLQAQNRTQAADIARKHGII